MYLTNNGNILRRDAVSNNWGFWTPVGNFLRIATREEVEYLIGNCPTITYVVTNKSGTIISNISEPKWSPVVYWQYLWSTISVDMTKSEKEVYAYYVRINNKKAEFIYSNEVFTDHRLIYGTSVKMDSAILACDELHDPYNEEWPCDNAVINPTISKLKSRIEKLRSLGIIRSVKQPRKSRLNTRQKH